MTLWAKFSLPGGEPAYARGDSEEFRRACREIFGPLVGRVREWPPGRHAWLMAEVPGKRSLSAFFKGLEKRLTPAGSLWSALNADLRLGRPIRAGGPAPKSLAGRGSSAVPSL